MQRGKNGSLWRRIPGSYICVQALFVLFFLYAVRAGCASSPEGGAHPEHRATAAHVASPGRRPG